VFEIYPKRFEDETITTVRFGFTVPSVDGTVKRLREQSAQVLTEAHDSPWGPRAVVQDLEPQDPDPETAAFISDSALHEAVAVAPGFAPRDGYPASFSPTLMTARYGSCLQVGMSRYQRHETRRPDLAVIRLCGTQQTIYFTAGNHDPPALSNRFD
jgi:hypothetical protein